MTTSGSGGQGRRYLGRLVGSATSDGQSGSGYYASFRPVYAIAPTCNAYSGSGISSRFIGRYAGVATSDGQSGSGYYASTRPVYVRGECEDGYSGSGASPRGRVVSRFAGVAASDGQSGSGYYATTRPVYVFPCCDSVHSGGSGGSGSSGSGSSGDGLPCRCCDEMPVGNLTATISITSPTLRSGGIPTTWTLYGPTVFGGSCFWSGYERQTSLPDYDYESFLTVACTIDELGNMAWRLLFSTSYFDVDYGDGVNRCCFASSSSYISFTSSQCSPLLLETGTVDYDCVLICNSTLTGCNCGATITMSITVTE